MVQNGRAIQVSKYSTSYCKTKPKRKFRISFPPFPIRRWGNWGTHQLFINHHCWKSILAHRSRRRYTLKYLNHVEVSCQLSNGNIILNKLLLSKVRTSRSPHCRTVAYPLAVLIPSYLRSHTMVTPHHTAAAATALTKEWLNHRAMFAKSAKTMEKRTSSR